MSEQDYLQERQVRLTAQRLLHSHLIPQFRGPDGAVYPMPTFWADIDLDLTGATLIDFALVGCAVRMFLAEDARFIGPALFDWTVFSGATQFNKATFTGPAQFNNAIFAGQASFTGATFEDDSHFGFSDGSRSKPRGNSFREAKFAVDAWFNGATFANVAFFDRAIFIGPARFDNVAFASFASFAEATFGDTGSPLRHEYFIRGTKIEYSFRLAKFARGANFRKARFADVIWFTGATFDETLILKGALIARAVVDYQSKMAEIYERNPTVYEVPWPSGWHPSVAHNTIKDLEDTWHTFERIEPEPEDPIDGARSDNAVE